MFQRQQQNSAAAVTKLTNMLLDICEDNKATSYQSAYTTVYLTCVYKEIKLQEISKIAFDVAEQFEQESLQDEPQDSPLRKSLHGKICEVFRYYTKNVEPELAKNVNGKWKVGDFRSKLATILKVQETEESQ